MNNAINKDKITLVIFIKAHLRGARLIKSIFPWYLTLNTISRFCQTAQPLAVLVFSARLIDELMGTRDIRTIVLYAALAVSVTFVSGVVQAVIDRKLRESQSVRVLCRYLRAKHYASLDYEHIEDSKVRALMADIDGAEQWSNYGLLRLFWVLPALFGSLFGLCASVILFAGAVSSAGAGVLLLLLNPVLPLVLTSLFIKKNVKLMKEMHRGMPKVNAMLQYYLENYIKPENAGKDIRIFNQQQTILDILRRVGFSRLREIMVRHNCPQSAVSGFVNSSLSAAVYIILGLKALAGVFTIGQMTQYVGAVTSFTGAVTGLFGIIANLVENTPTLLKHFEFLDLPKLKYEGTLTTEKRADNEYEFEFKNVSFRYPNTSEYALRNLNLKLRVGQKMAVVGMNGSGKTTMIKLLCRLYDPTEVEITLNGIDIRKYDYREYMDLFAIVFQDFKLTGFSLGQNVAAAVHYDARRVTQLLETVGFGEKISLETPLYKSFDKNGTEISGGEAQKIALSRALYKDAPVIVLDEPTAALDPIAESEIYSKFDGITHGKTAIYISHRLSSCRFCDDIAVFHEGEITQRGSHDKLLADTNGEYYELWNAQAQYYEDSAILR